MNEPTDNFDLSENNLVNDSICEIISDFEIQELKLEPIIKSEISEAKETVASTLQNLEFIDCGETIKEEIKEEVEEEYQRDPLRLSNAVQSLDEPVTYEEFICEG